MTYGEGSEERRLHLDLIHSGDCLQKKKISLCIISDNGIGFIFYRGHLSLKTGTFR